MDIVIRPLQDSDIPPVIELTKKTWGGHDYLPKTIYSWLSNALCYPIVLEFEGKVAAVANVKAIDDGTTGWMEGLRVHPKLREKGLAKYMTNRLVEIASEKGFKRIRLVTATENPAPQKLARYVGMSVIDRYSVFWKRYGRGIKWIKDDESICEVDASQVLRFIKSTPELFQSKSIVIHWDVFMANSGNIERIGDWAKYFISESEEGRSLSLGFRNDIPNEPEWCFSVYSTSADAFVSKLHFHLKFARERGLRDLLCIHKPEFRRLYKDIKWLKKRNHELELLLFEREFCPIDMA